tara:strand:- start:929 stop:2677 length:1749 start_codon:yes stop_codon:yes gene_type:complete
MASPRVLICGIVHETNTYASPICGLTTIQDFHILSGDKIVQYHSNARTITGGFIQCAKELKYEIVPGYLATAEPSGTITDEAYTYMKQQVLQSVHSALQSEKGLQAIALDLHGAGVAQSVEDIESDLGGAIRELIGPTIKLICGLDLHGNIHDKMVDIFDFMVGFKQYPHEDQHETGHKAFSILPRLLSPRLENTHTSIIPKMHIEHLPITLPTTSTDIGFASYRMNQYAQNIIERYRTEAFFSSEEMLDVSIFHGFPYSDVSHVGVHVVAISSDNIQNARDVARQIAYWIWTHRNEFIPNHPNPNDSVLETLTVLNTNNPNHDPMKTVSLGPVVINETNDNTGCGTPGDGTSLLTAMLSNGLGRKNTSKRNTVFGYFCDHGAVNECIKNGIGKIIKELPLGGKTGSLHGATIYVDAYVSKITDGRFTLTNFAPGVRCNVGPTVLITLVDSGIDIIITSKRQQSFGPDIFHLHGLDVLQYDVVAVKSSVHFRAGFRNIALQIITCDSPGLSSCLVENFEHLHVGKDVKLWPNDLTTTWKPGMYSSSHNSIELRKRLKAVDESPATPKAAAAARLKTYLQSLL